MSTVPPLILFPFLFSLCFVEWDTVVGDTYLPDSTVSHIKNSNVMVIASRPLGLSSYFVLNDKTRYCIIFLFHFSTPL
jgi:hypothetical protein